MPVTRSRAASGASFPPSAAHLASKAECGDEACVGCISGEGACIYETIPKFDPILHCKNLPVLRDHEFYWFGDQVTARRCLHCDTLETSS